MRTAKLVAPYRIEVGEAQEPQVNDSHQVLVRVKAVGICGTDLHTFKGERNGRKKCMERYYRSETGRNER